MGLKLGNASACNAVAMFRGSPDELMKCARERHLVIESGLNRDIDQRYAGLAHQLLRELAW